MTADLSKLSSAEQQLLGLVMASERRASDTITGVTRRSDREFDVGVEGGDGKLSSFSMWLPLGAIHALVDWPAFADLTDYPEMTADGDWSGVRDSSDEAKWAIFDQAVLPLLKRKAPELEFESTPGQLVNFLLEDTDAGWAADGTPLGEQLAAHLQAAGIEATYEHPGYVNVTTKLGDLGVGTVDGFWGADILDSTGQTVNFPDQLDPFDWFKDKAPNAVSPQSLVDAVKRILAWANS